MGNNILSLQSMKKSSPELVERQYDHTRCECRTTTGGRCRDKTQYVIKAQDSSGQVAEYGACSRHWADFTVRT